MLLLSDNGVWRLDFERSRTWSERAYARAKEDGDPALVASAAAGLAIACALGGDVAEGQRRREEVVARLDGMGDEEVAPSLITDPQHVTPAEAAPQVQSGAATAASAGGGGSALPSRIQLQRAPKQ